MFLFFRGNRKKKQFDSDLNLCNIDISIVLNARRTQLKLDALFSKEILDVSV
eukprot:m.157543 g.157543  ORF g.157543 m.157543 type:complete len:52 (+) comp17972_c0_seq1:1519-1674(+)